MVVGGGSLVSLALFFACAKKKRRGDERREKTGQKPSKGMRADENHEKDRENVISMSFFAREKGEHESNCKTNQKTCKKTMKLWSA